MTIPLPVVLLTLLSVATCAGGEIRLDEIRSDDRPIIPFHEFGFSNRGQLELNLTVLSRSRVRPESGILSKMGFFLCTREAWLKVLQQLQDEKIDCVLESSEPYKVFTFESLPTPITTKLDFLHSQSQPGLYTLLFVNCNLGLRVSMNVRYAMYNFGAGESNRRDYLSAGETDLPGVYLLFAVVYLAMTSVWFGISRKMILNRSGIHFLMFLVVVLKALNLLCESRYKFDIKTRGYAHGWFHFLFYVSSFFKDIAFFLVIVLIGSGWPFLKSDLQGKEKKVLMIIVIPLQLVANTARLMIEKNGLYGADWLVWNQMLLLADTVCWCAVLFSIFRTNKNLRGTVRTTTASRDAKADQLSWRKRSLFRRYGVVVICYISFTRVVVPAFEGVTSFECVTSGVVSRESATMALCVFTGYMVHACYQDSA